VQQLLLRWSSEWIVVLRVFLCLSSYSMNALVHLCFHHQQIKTQGDYSAMVLDPTDDCTFYYVNQYYNTSSSKGWQTKIAAFQLADNCTE
jgi:hypothetical protein